MTFLKIVFFVFLLSNHYFFGMTPEVEEQKITHVIKTIYNQEFKQQEKSTHIWVMNSYVTLTDRENQSMVYDTPGKKEVFLKKFYQEACAAIEQNVRNGFEVLKKALPEQRAQSDKPLLLETFFSYSASSDCLKKRYQPGVMHGAHNVHKLVFEEIAQQLNTEIMFIDYNDFEFDKDRNRDVLKKDVVSKIDANSVLVYIQSTSTINSTIIEHLNEFLQLHSYNNPLILCIDNVTAQSLEKYNNEDGIKAVLDAFNVVKIENMKKSPQLKANDKSKKINILLATGFFLFVIAAFYLKKEIAHLLSNFQLPSYR